MYLKYSILCTLLRSVKIKNSNNPILGGGRPDSAPMTSSTVAPKRKYNVGVMGYENLSYYVGKTPKQVSGPKIFLGPVQRPSNFGTLKFGFFNFHLDLGHQNKRPGPKMIMHHKDIGLSFHLQKVEVNWPKNEWAMAISVQLPGFSWKSAFRQYRLSARKNYWWPRAQLWGD